MKNIFIFFFCFLNIQINAQITRVNWNVFEDSISLTPTRFKGRGTISIRKSSSSEIEVNGEIIISPKEKQIFFNDGSNMFKLKVEDILSIGINNYNPINHSDLINPHDLYDTLLKEYRTNLYKSVLLNEVEILLIKNYHYDLSGNGLSVLNPRVLKGKICYLSLNKIILLSEDGELTTLVDGDFNYIKFDNNKVFECSNLYNLYFKQFEQKLLESISEWKQNIKRNNLESLTEIFGPFDKILTIAPDRKLFIWNKPLMKYQFEINSLGLNSSFSSSINSIYQNKYTNYISPLFYYGNVYRSTFDYNGNYNKPSSYETVSTSINRQMQTGNIVAKDESMTISITTDAQNNILNVYQERLFAELGYGLPYRFINF